MSNSAKSAKKPPVNITIVPKNTAIVGNIEAFRKALHEDIEIKCFYLLRRTHSLPVSLPSARWLVWRSGILPYG